MMNFLKDFLFGLIMFVFGAAFGYAINEPRPITIDTGSGYVRVKEIQSKELEVDADMVIGDKIVPFGKATYAGMVTAMDEGFASRDDEVVANEATIRFKPVVVYRVMMPDGLYGTVRAEQPLVKVTCPVGMRGDICSLSVRNTLKTLEIKQ